MRARPMASPPPPSQSPVPRRRDWLDAAGVVLILVAVLITGYGLTALYSLNRAAFYGALIGAASGLLLGMWPILQYLHRKG